MLLKTQFAEERLGVGKQDFANGAVRIERKRDGDKAAHQVRVAVAPIMEHPFPGRIRAIAKLKPHLADAAADFIRTVVGGLAQGLERPTEFEATRFRKTRVVLAAAHLDSDPTNNRLKNLRALCQRCHMLQDRPHHLAQRWITYRRRSAVGDLFLGPYPALIAALTSRTTAALGLGDELVADAAVQADLIHGTTANA